MWICVKAECPQNEKIKQPKTEKKRVNIPETIDSNINFGFSFELNSLKLKLISIRAWQ